jgi:hypothetical protein
MEHASPSSHSESPLPSMPSSRPDLTRHFGPPHSSRRGQFVGSSHGCADCLSFFLQFILGRIVKIDERTVVRKRRLPPIAGALIGALSGSIGLAWHTPNLSQFGDVHRQSSGIWRKHAPRTVCVSKKDKFKRADRTCGLDTDAPPLFASDVPGSRDSCACI